MATALQIAELRRKVVEPTTTTYTDGVLATYIDRYPVVDGDDAFDLNAAAADIWDEKAAALASYHDFTADGATLHTSQRFTQAQSMARFYRARRSVKTITARPEPEYEGDNDA